MFARCCCFAEEETEVTFAASLGERWLDAVKVFESPAAAADISRPTLLARASAPTARTASGVSGEAAEAKIPKGGAEAPGEEAEAEPEPRSDTNVELSFPESATQGRSCILLMENSDDTRPATRTAATYRVSVRERALLLDRGAGEACIRVPVDGLEDIFQLLDGASCFPPSVLIAASAAELENLLYIVYSPDPSDASCDVETLCILETSSKGKDDLMDHLKWVGTA
mmetsp:Transcript_147484/g.473779  ORF Transcript_147484/g.473779 Transcript_147484/m.473779 type:complete len:227 (-) Transcript_147484:380-1060(-)